MRIDQINIDDVNVIFFLSLVLYTCINPFVVYN